MVGPGLKVRIVHSGKKKGLIILLIYLVHFFRILPSDFLIWYCLFHSKRIENTHLFIFIVFGTLMMLICFSLIRSNPN